MDDEQKITGRLTDRIDSVAEDAWNRCAGKDNPFVQHAFLKALEDSGSASAQTGWAPQHLLLENSQGELVGAVPMYLKGNSAGEYVFDHGWAEAFERAGGSYYPKLQVSVPFTPATGPRLLAAPGALQTQVRGQLVQGCIEAARQLEVSSLHFTFATQDDWEELGQAGLLLRKDIQFHWQNNGYETFDDFLAALSSRKRKNIRKERAQAVSDGIDIEVITGDDLQAQHWDAFYQFYTDTGARKWGTPYLTREFFDLIGASMSEKIALVMCRRDGRYVAGALNFIGGDTLFGRYWGCVEHHPSLHFETCYYQAIDLAIALGLQYVEAGAQGEHKLARGYRPVQTLSAHWIANTSFRVAVEEYLERERQQIEYGQTLMDKHVPFKNLD